MEISLKKQNEYRISKVEESFTNLQKKEKDTSDLKQIDISKTEEKINKEKLKRLKKGLVI